MPRAYGRLFVLQDGNSVGFLHSFVTERTGYIGNNFGPNGLSSGSNTRVSRSKICHCSSYFFDELVAKNFTVTLRPIGNDRGLPSKPITASRTSRSLLSDGSPVEMLFLPIIADILTTDPVSVFPSRASAWIITFCPIDALSTSLSSISALMYRVEVSARLNNGRGVTVLKDSPGLANTRRTVPVIGARIKHFPIRSWTVRARPSAASTSASARALSSCNGGAANNSSVRTAARRLASATPRSRTACSYEARETSSF